jgi:hypothetical protein
MFYPQIHKLDKVQKSGNLWGPIGPLDNELWMGYTSGDHLRCEYTVAGTLKNGKKEKNGVQKSTKLTEIFKNDPKMTKTAPVK